MCVCSCVCMLCVHAMRARELFPRKRHRAALLLPQVEPRSYSGEKEREQLPARTRREEPGSPPPPGAASPSAAQSQAPQLEIGNGNKSKTSQRERAEATQNSPGGAQGAEPSCTHFRARTQRARPAQGVSRLQVRGCTCPISTWVCSSLFPPPKPEPRSRHSRFARFLTVSAVAEDSHRASHYPRAWRHDFLTCKQHAQPSVPRNSVAVLSRRYRT